MGSSEGEGSGEGVGDSVGLGGLVGGDEGVADFVGDEGDVPAARAGRADPAVRMRVSAKPGRVRATAEHAVPWKNTRTG
jgi:hypothetical protein